MVMLRQFQISLNRFIEGFQDRWETQPSFRATWSIIGCAFALVFLCTSLLISVNIANSLTAGKTTASANDNVLYAGGNGQQPTHQVDQAAANTTTTPNANPIATSNAATPTPTVSPTPLGATPGDSPTPDNGTPTLTVPPNDTVQAQQQPAGGWTPTGPNQITNVQTNPQVPNGQIKFTIDFQCGSPVTVSGTLDGNGAAQNLGSVTIPGCFKSPTQKLVNVTVTIDGQQVQFQTPFYAKGV